jgi:4-hydroxy-tetrahydrodipicolinate reductase
MKKIRFISYGLGPIGSSIARLALSKGFEIVGGIDIDPLKVGKDVGEVIDSERIGIRVSDDPDSILKTNADIVIHSTVSYLKLAKAQIMKAIENGKNVISTCEELSYPYFHNSDLAEEINKAAKENNVTVLGTGINPGFLMDKLVLTMSGVCQEISKIQAERIVDTSKRRLPLQKKTGAGLTKEEFQRGVEEGRIRHVGLPESIVMIAGGLGMKLDKIEEKIDPVIAEEEVSSEFIKVKKGDVTGIKQIAYGIKNGKNLITLKLQMSLKVKDEHDGIRIFGKPRVDLRIDGGIHGDLSTAAVVVNCIPRVIDSKPGLITMKDLPVSFLR